MATPTAGTPFRRVPERSSSSIPRAFSPNGPTTWASRCASTTPHYSGATPSTAVRQRAELLASACGIDAEPVWQWGFIERVSTGFANLRDFGGDQGKDFLEVATRCL